MGTTMDAPKGLEGVRVDQTALSLVEGNTGRLSYRGINVDSLIEARFADVAHWVLTGRFDPDFEPNLVEAGELGESDERALADAPRDNHPMQTLQAMVLMLDAPIDRFEAFGEAAPGVAIAAKLPAVTARMCTHGRAEDSSPGYCERFVRTINPDATERAIEAFSVMQILQLEHGFNAGTFAARVVASTLAPIKNVMAAAIGALHGPLHGGADEAALDMADSIETPAAASAYVDRCFEEGIKMPGMGHREYRVVDPRAVYAKDFARGLSRGTAHEETFAVLEAVENRFAERAAEKGKPLHPNLEFYKGLVYRIVGLPNELFTCAFAMARCFGYIAHFIESRADNRIIRPAARYVGPPVSDELPSIST